MVVYASGWRYIMGMSDTDTSDKDRCAVVCCDRTRHRQASMSASVCSPHYLAIKRGVEYAESHYGIDDLEPLEYEELKA